MRVTDTDLPIVVEPAEEQNKRDLPIMAGGGSQNMWECKKGQKSITYFLNNSPKACLGQTIIDLPVVCVF